MLVGVDHIQNVDIALQYSLQLVIIMRSVSEGARVEGFLRLRNVGRQGYFLLHREDRGDSPLRRSLLEQGWDFQA